MPLDEVACCRHHDAHDVLETQRVGSDTSVVVPPHPTRVPPVQFMRFQNGAVWFASRFSSCGSVRRVVRFKQSFWTTGWTGSFQDGGGAVADEKEVSPMIVEHRGKIARMALHRWHFKVSMSGSQGVIYEDFRIMNKLLDQYLGEKCNRMMAK